MKNRYLVFIVPAYYPSGFQDFKRFFDNIEDAKKWSVKELGMDNGWIEMIDSKDTSKYWDFNSIDTNWKQYEFKVDDE